MADVVTEGCAMAAAHRLSIPWKQNWDTKLMTDMFKCFWFFFHYLVVLKLLLLDSVECADWNSFMFKHFCVYTSKMYLM